jgi:hypothetical protein
MRPRQFDVFSNPDDATGHSHPYFVVLQANALDHLNTIIVAPLVAPKSIPCLEPVMPEVIVNDARFVIAMPDLSAISARLVGRAVANLETSKDRIIAAIELVFLGI